jgi:hypothetical protein
MRTRSQALESDSPYACFTASRYLSAILPDDLTRCIVESVWGGLHLRVVQRLSSRTRRYHRRHLL